MMLLTVINKGKRNRGIPFRIVRDILVNRLLLIENVDFQGDLKLQIRYVK